ncbi:penicillin-binding protein activator [Polymorphum gilvum]|uniref:penicillin-binding protein activator n=1 Tax=Polymorphum gilvum TaxID=991904 RepID=UPI001F59FD8A|nr:penicillin-binding protein activator [Polymorphum gilvum]
MHHITVAARSTWAGKAKRLAVALLGAGLVAGCMGSNLGTLPGGAIGPADTTPAVTGETIGTGSVRVGLLLPLSAGGSATSIATVFRNSAQLALNDFQGADIQILIKDTAGTADGGRAAAQAAIAEGAELLLGPVFAPAVSGAASVARSSGVPIVAFSTDTSVASRGVYLLSFLPAGDVKRIVSHAARQNRRSFAALLPDDAYGAVAEAAFRQEVGRAGGRIVSIQRYKLSGTDTADLQAKTASLASAMSQVDALFIPAGGGVPAFVAQALTAQGANLGTVKLLGSGQWESQQVLTSPMLTGSWFPGPDKAGFEQLAARYQAAYGSPPPRNSSLAYDGTILAAGLVRSAGAQRFSDPVLTNRDGFLGIDGVFRFLPNGESERGLAVYEVTGSGAQMVNPAPRDFRAGS